ncbi:uncharacterized protein LOC129590783 [Paramacrobiotus metropolitanus]|uniref:uncharacterized protein LOC129590783 n=1 Tax=Paramacrobiotus metropolitanus TaxID=2943436 RepID=UPI00244658DD|nr:uncharacterized protein LOC129590783 [Paramacrobiotus metropolitanus]
MSSYGALAQVVRRKQKDAGVPATRVRDLADIDVQYFKNGNARGSNVFREDTGAHDQNRIIVFATDANITHLMRSPVWLSNGTFRFGATTPLVYVLLPGKCELLYTGLFHVVHDAIVRVARQGNVGPKYMIMDFEQSAIKAFGTVFPESVIGGCNFHLGQSVHRKLVDLGHKLAYANDPEFSLNCRMVLALAFVPPTDVERVFNELLQKPGFPFRPTDLFVQYIRPSYIGKTVLTAAGCVNKAPLCPIRMWNCYERLLQDVHRTTNRLEAWHKTFAETVDKDHPEIYGFFNLLC